MGRRTGPSFSLISGPLASAAAPVRNALLFSFLCTPHGQFATHSTVFPHSVVLDACCLRETLFLVFNLLLSSLAGKYLCIRYANTLVEFSRSLPDDSA